MQNNMNGFKITTQDGQEIKFEFYVDTAPVTSIAFQNILPFSRTFSPISGYFA